MGKAFVRTSLNDWLTNLRTAFHIHLDATAVSGLLDVELSKLGFERDDFITDSYFAQHGFETFSPDKHYTAKFVGDSAKAEFWRCWDATVRWCRDGCTGYLEGEHIHRTKLITPVNHQIKDELAFPYSLQLRPLLGPSDQEEFRQSEIHMSFANLHPQSATSMSLLEAGFFPTEMPAERGQWSKIVFTAQGAKHLVSKLYDATAAFLAGRSDFQSAKLLEERVVRYEFFNFDYRNLPPVIDCLKRR